MPQLVDFSELYLENYLNYWFLSDRSFLHSIGIDIDQLPAAKDLRNKLKAEIPLPDKEQQTHIAIVLEGSRACGHLELRNLSFGSSAIIELHIWNNEDRHKGLGTELIDLIPSQIMFRFELKSLIAQAYASNPAANQLCLKAGFQYIAQEMLQPSPWHFKQAINQYQYTKSS